MTEAARLTPEQQEAYRIIGNFIDSGNVHKAGWVERLRNDIAAALTAKDQEISKWQRMRESALHKRDMAEYACDQWMKRAEAAETALTEAQATIAELESKHKRVTRFEVIDHRLPVGEIGRQTGRVFHARRCHIELSYQDDGQTLKVFIDGTRHQ